MKSASAALAAHLAGPVTELATCWRLKREDGAEQGFTDHDFDLIIDGLTYKASTGYTPSSIASSDQLNVDSVDVEGFLESATISELDLDGGRYDHAEVEIFMVQWSDLTAGKLVRRTGRLGEIARGEDQFYAEVRGLAQHLQQAIGERITPTCLARLGDGRCKVALGPLTVSSSVAMVVDRRRFTDTARTEADHWFRYGLLTWTSGANQGLAMEVKAYTLTSQLFELFRRMPAPLAVGDGFTVYAGCDKTLATCGTKFSNVVNFRGFPHVPGPDEMQRFGGQG